MLTKEIQAVEDCANSDDSERDADDEASSKAPTRPGSPVAMTASAKTVSENSATGSKSGAAKSTEKSNAVDKFSSWRRRLLLLIKALNLTDAQQWIQHHQENIMMLVTAVAVLSWFLRQPANASAKQQRPPWYRTLAAAFNMRTL